MDKVQLITFEAAWAIEQNRQPLTSRQVGVQVDNRDLAWMLLMLAKLDRIDPCALEDCEECNDHNRLWWDLYASLPRWGRLVVQRCMIHHQIPFPAGAWDTVPLQ